MATRRSVDWQVLLPNEHGSGPSRAVSSPTLARLLAAFDAIATLNDVDEILRRSVELARNDLGLSRPGIIVYDESSGMMLGTWGTGADGSTCDEHHVMYKYGDWDQLAYDRARNGIARWTVFENCPVIAHSADESRVLGRGDVACTPIYSPERLQGLMFNTAADFDAPLEDEKQSLGAVLCSRLGPLLDFSTSPGDANSLARRLPSAHENPLALRAAQLLSTDPTLTGKELSNQLGMGASRLGRLFRRELGMSLVDYRNHLRLDRFFALVDPHGGNLLQAALDAGFGSYTQFHRVFRERFDAAPKDFLAARIENTYTRK